MPTYTVFAQSGRLTATHKQNIAAEITRAHSAKTGAQNFFAQVIFQEMPSGNHFLGGTPLKSDHIYVHGQIRAGRDAKTKRALLEHLLSGVSAAAEIPKVSTWVYIVDLPPSQMAEYGHILPEPGTEAAWLESLPAQDRTVMENTGLPVTASANTR